MIFGRFSLTCRGKSESRILTLLNYKPRRYMKRFIAFLTATIMVAAAAWDCNAQSNAEGNAQGNSQPKKVSVLGDSYSTFTGHNPEGYAPFYPNDRNDVTEVEQTWWSLYIKAMGYELEQNNSWGGTTICGTGYGRMDSSASSFNARVDMLGNPDIIFIFGGTNDAWAGSPIGEYKWEGWTKEDCKSFRPAYACLLDSLKKKYPDAEIYSILNSELREEINESSREVCKHYGVQLIELYDIEKQNGHPSIKGMQSICDQLLDAIK
jgi:lysophospholipase L1-like esterase